MTDSYNIQVTKQPPPYAFSDELVGFELTVSKQQEGPTDNDQQLTLRANVHLHDGRLPARDVCSSNVAKVIVDPSTPLKVDMQQGLTQKILSVKCKVEGKVSPSEKFNVCICISLHCNNVQVCHAYTSAIHLVNYKLYVQPRDWEEAWYKDEGGRDKCMIAQVELHNAEGSMATGIRAPIRLTLRYADAQSTNVRNQDILRILGHPKQFVDPDSGTVSIRFRIEDVSKNHQGQDFKVEICADSSRFADIAPAYTPPVSVRSKRTKRQRMSANADTMSNTSATGGGVEEVKPSTAAAGGKQQQQQQQQIIQHDRIIQQLDSASHPNKPFVTEFQVLKNQLQQQHSHFTKVGGYSSSRIDSAASSNSTLARKRDALLGILNWAEEVVNGLYPLQWKVVGYAPFPDGSLDHNHPYYSMPNPNSVISKLLSMYSSTVKDDLRILMSEIETAYTQRAPPAEVMANIREQELRLPTLSHPYDYPSTDGGRISHLGQAAATFDTRITLGQQSGTSYYDTKMPHSMVSKGQIQASNTFSPSSIRRQQSEEDSQEELEAQVMYVLAKQYKSLRTGLRLGFPAFNSDKEIIGFFQESSNRAGMEKFLPIHHLKQDFGAFEREQASQILKDSIESRSEALHCIKDYDSVSSLLASALVFDWSNKGSDHFGRSSSAFS